MPEQVNGSTLLHQTSVALPRSGLKISQFSNQGIIPLLVVVQEFKVRPLCTSNAGINGRAALASQRWLNKHGREVMLLPPSFSRQSEVKEAPLNNHRCEDGSKVIEGTWVILEAELGGQKLPDENIKGAKLILNEDKYQFQNDQRGDKLYLGGKIKAMDIMGREGPNKGKTFLAIYELEGDTLKICYDLAGKIRPKEFKRAEFTVADASAIPALHEITAFELAEL